MGLPAQGPIGEETSRVGLNFPRGAGAHENHGGQSSKIPQQRRLPVSMRDTSRQNLGACSGVEGMAHEQNEAPSESALSGEGNTTACSRSCVQGASVGDKQRWRPMWQWWQEGTLSGGGKGQWAR
ncbi:unnamed protein product [Calypogeia fissa]